MKGRVMVQAWGLLHYKDRMGKGFVAGSDNSVSKDLILDPQIIHNKPDVVMHFCNPSTVEAETRGCWSFLDSGLSYINELQVQ